MNEHESTNTVCDAINMCRKRDECLFELNELPHRPRYCPYYGKLWLKSAVSVIHPYSGDEEK